MSIMRITKYVGRLKLRSGFSSRTATTVSTTQPTSLNGLSIRTPLASYEELVRLGDITEDIHQKQAVVKLQELYDQILLIDATEHIVTDQLDVDSASNWFSSLFTSSDPSPVKQLRCGSNSIKGLYMYGGTGCGKTFIMDLFYEVIPIKKKKRVHFSNFMIDIHKRLHRLKSSTKGSSKAIGDNIMEKITNELMDEAYLLCFDEFQVTDIADAMILKGLFESMLSKGAIVVATSNRAPVDLYKNGLQRILFLPFIKTLNESTNVHSLMESSMDYRLVKSADRALNMYLSPITLESKKILNSQFKQLSVSISQDIPQPQLQLQLDDKHKDQSYQMLENFTSGSRFTAISVFLRVFGHQVNIPEAVIGRRIARFSFQQLCEEALGAADYIHIAETFRIVFIVNVPNLNLDHRNEMRRFITLIDALYEESVQVVILAEEIPTKLLKLTPKEKASPLDEVFAFDRTVSRLLEMQSQPYLHASTVRYPVESGGSDWLLREITGGKSKIIGEDLSLSIWKQYNWGRDADIPLPVTCLQVLYLDLLNLKKTVLINKNQNSYILEIDLSIENIKEKLSIISHNEINFDDFSSLLFYN